MQADETMAALLEQSVRLGNELAFMRAGYNDAGRAYNTRIRAIPGSITAGIFRFRPRQFI